MHCVSKILLLVFSFLENKDLWKPKLESCYLTQEKRLDFIMNFELYRFG